MAFLLYVAGALCAVLVYVIVDVILRRPRINGFHTKHILVTGCDSGFGLLLAKRLDLFGCHVYAGCLTEAGKTSLTAQCTERVKPFILDVTSLGSIESGFLFVEKHVPQEGLWGLVNNAGILGHSLGPLEWLSAVDFRKTLEVNTLGPIQMTLTFLPLLTRGRHGARVVNMSSVGGRVSTWGPTIPYFVSKFGVEAFSDGLRQHCMVEKLNVSVHILEPGPYDTGLMGPERSSRFIRQSFKRAPSRVQKEFGEIYVQTFTRRFEQKSAAISSPRMDHVVDAYIHALSAARPRKRYSVGWLARLLVIPLSYAPSWLTDWFVVSTAVRFPRASDATSQ